MAGNKANTKPLTNTDTGFLLVLDLPVYRGPSRRGGGNAGRVSCSRPDGRFHGCPVSLSVAIAPATALRRDQGQPGAKAPGQRPPRPRREPPCVAIVAAVLAGPWSLTGRGDAVRFPSARNGRHPSDGSE